MFESIFGFKWEVQAVEPKEDYTLILTYKNGKKRLFDCKPLLGDSFAAPLKDKNFFMAAKAHHHTVMWNDKLDLCPEYLYENSVKIK